MPNYQNSIIYKLVCLDSTILDIYVGSSTNFIKRKQQHKADCYNLNGKNYNYYVYKFIRLHGCFINWQMIEIEKFPCNTKRELETRERFHIEDLVATLNQKVPTQSKKDYRVKNKVKIALADKEYNDKNKVKIAVKHREYYDANLEVILQQKKDYYKENKDYVKDKVKQYNENNKEKIQAKRNQRILCECGKEYPYSHKVDHMRSNFHQDFIKLKSN